MEEPLHEITFRYGQPLVGCCCLRRHNPARVTSGKLAIGGEVATGFGQPLKEIEV